MGKRKAHIENLRIRLLRSASADARAIADGLGTELLRTIAETTRGRTGGRRIGELSAARITAAEGVGAGALRKQIASRVAEELRKNLR